MASVPARRVTGMAGGFDPRIVPPAVVAFLQACGRVAPFHLGGGAALAGVHLRHRFSADADLFVHDRHVHRDLVQALPAVAEAAGSLLSVLRDTGNLVRAGLDAAGIRIEIDVVYDPVSDIEPPPPPVDGVLVESLTDLRANKITCILSRSEPRDLVDLLFLDRSGHPPEADLALALRKDAGVDPGILAWLLGQFPVEPLPQMIEPLTADELREFRDSLRERFRRLAVP